MKSIPQADLDAMWARHHAEWRACAQITSQWKEANETDPRLLQFTASDGFWEVLANAQITLLITREYEHLVMALRVAAGKPMLSYMPLPHPSGLVVDHHRQVVHIASTRNPNQVYDLRPITGQMERLDMPAPTADPPPLAPVRSRFLPGCTYLHDLALIGGALYGNAVGQNAIVRLFEDGRHERVWWPRCIEREGAPVFGRNHIQLNSIASGDDLSQSFFSASTDKISARRPGHRNFPVDRRGVIFSGATREPIAFGLTRPHSARLHQGQVWVDNSGYGEMGIAANGRFTPVTRLPGWTRGLCFHEQIAFVGTSRVIPRFRQYAPGLDVDSSRCGLHALDTRTGEVLGSLFWPFGNQIFAIDWIPSRITGGLPYLLGGRKPSDREKKLFYSFDAFGASSL